MPANTEHPDSAQIIPILSECDEALHGLKSISDILMYLISDEEHEWLSYLHDGIHDKTAQIKKSYKKLHEIVGHDEEKTAPVLSLVVTERGGGEE